MNRREALYRVLMLGGAAMVIPQFTISCLNKDNNGLVDPFLFSSSENKLMVALVDTILPKTNTPSASEVGVPEFIQMMLSDCYGQNEQDIFKKGLSQIDTNFVTMDKENRNKVLTKLEEDSMAVLKGNPRGVTFWKILKELTLLGYFTSKTGMTQAMEYVPVPGKFELIKMKKGQKIYSEYLGL